MNEVYQSPYQQIIYTPIYMPTIVFQDDEELEQETAVAIA